MTEEKELEAVIAKLRADEDARSVAFAQQERRSAGVGDFYPTPRFPRSTEDELRQQAEKLIADRRRWERSPEYAVRNALREIEALDIDLVVKRALDDIRACASRDFDSDGEQRAMMRHAASILGAANALKARALDVLCAIPSNVERADVEQP